MTNAPLTTDHEAAALTLRNLHLGTDYPEVAWQEAPESERDAWVKVARLEAAMRRIAERDYFGDPANIARDALRVPEEDADG